MRNLLLHGPVERVERQHPQIVFESPVRSALQEELHELGYMLPKERDFL